MNRTLKKMLVIAGSTIPALALFAGAASADVSVKNKLKNGDFAAGANHWVSQGAGGAKLQVHGGVLYAGNMLNTVVASTSNVKQCVKVSGSTRYELSGKIRIPSGQDRSGAANFNVMYYADDNCSSFPLSQHQTTGVTDFDAWKLQKMTTQAPSNAQSASIRLHVTKNQTIVPYYAGHSFHAAFDDIQFLPKDVIVAPPPVTPQPQPEPEDEPAQEEPAPDAEDEPAPQPEHEPAPDADEAPEDDGETVEAPADGPELPDLPADEPDAPGGAGEDAPADSGTDSPADQDDGNARSDEPSQPAPTGDADADDGGDSPDGEQALEGSDADSAGGAGSNSNGVPTPAAPETGNAPSPKSGFGATELAIAAAAGLTLLGLAFIAGTRRRKDEQAGMRFE